MRQIQIRREGVSGSLCKQGPSSLYNTLYPLTHSIVIHFNPCDTLRPFLCQTTCPYALFVCPDPEAVDIGPGAAFVSRDRDDLPAGSRGVEEETAR